MITLQNTIFGKYDTVIFDLDGTLFDCYTPEGDGIGAYATMYPYKLISPDIVQDVDNNIIILQRGARKVLNLLDLDGINMGVVSSGEKDDTPFSAQPSIMLLKKFNIYKYFNYDIITKRNIKKEDYVKPLGRTLFIDNTSSIVEEVEKRDLVDVLRRDAFKHWEDLISTKKSVASIRETLSWQGTESIAKQFIQLYQIEPEYSGIRRKLKWGEEVTDEENIRYHKYKLQIPKLFETILSFILNTIQGTLTWEKQYQRKGSGKYRPYPNAQLRLILDLQTRLAEIEAVEDLVNDEEQWPAVFIAIDNVLNTVHIDFPYLNHLMWEETDLKENDFNYYAIEEAWGEFAEVLRLQGKLSDIDAVGSLPGGEVVETYDIQPEESVKHSPSNKSITPFRPADENLYENNLHQDLENKYIKRPLTPYGSANTNPLFICLWTPQSVKDDLEHIKDLDDDLHITLVYREDIGDKDEVKKKQLLSVISNIAKEYKEGIECSFGGGAVFNNPDHSVVALVNMKEGPKLFNDLVNAVEEVYGKWERKYGFTAHMSIYADGGKGVPELKDFNWTSKHIGVTFGDTRESNSEVEDMYSIELGTGKVGKTLEKLAASTFGTGVAVLSQLTSKTAAPESYMPDSGIEQRNEDRFETFHVEEALPIHNRVEFPFGGYEDQFHQSLNSPLTIMYVDKEQRTAGVNDPIEDPKMVAKNTGFRYEGVQNFPNMGRQLYMFTDPQTGSTFSFYGGQVTTENVSNFILERRKLHFRYRQASLDPSFDYDTTRKNVFNYESDGSMSSADKQETWDTDNFLPDLQHDEKEVSTLDWNGRENLQFWP